MTVRAVAALPSAPLLVPAISPRQPDDVAVPLDALRADVEATLAALPAVATVVLVASGPDATVGDGGAVDLTGAGHPEVAFDVPVDRALVAAVATATRSPRVRADRVAGDLAILAALVHTARPDVGVVPVTVAASADPTALAGFAAGLADAAGAADTDVAVIAAGDLAATRETSSPRAAVEGATAFDDAVTAAVRRGDRARLATLGPGEAARVVARGWAPLVVLVDVAADAGTPLIHAALHAPRGVGQLVASSTRSDASAAASVAAPADATAAVPPRP